MWANSSDNRDAGTLSVPVVRRYLCVSLRTSHFPPTQSKETR